MKSIHLGNRDRKKRFPIFNKDFEPLVQYSINKKNRWNFMENLSTLWSPEVLDIIVLERVELLCSPYFCYVPFPHYFDYFKIRAVHELHDSAPDSEALPSLEIQTLSTRSILGQPFKSFRLDHDEVPRIAYHVITPPANFEKLHNKRFHPGKHDKKGHRTSAHWRRCEVLKDAISSLVHEQFEDLDEPVDMWDDYMFYDKYPPPREFYNLEDHFKTEDFVMVKDRTKKKKRKLSTSSISSTWSIV